MLHTTTNSGLHDFVGGRVLARYARPGMRAANDFVFYGRALLGDNHIFVLEAAP